jgi:hypothetical protein
MKCVICGHIFTEADTGYVKGSISGEVFELLPLPKNRALEDSSLKATGQTFDHKGVKMCVSHFEDIPRYIADNLKTNAVTRKG